MANYQVDNIEMSIIATVEKAIQSFDLAIAKAEKLNQSMGNLDSGIKKTTSSVKSMSNEFKSLDTGSKGLTNTSKQIESIRKSSLGLSDTIKRGFNMLGVVFGLRAMVGLIRKSISLSAEFGENYNLFYVSMDKSVDKAMEFQKSMNSILGANMSETMRYQGFFKALAESLGIASDSAYKMSENLTKLTYDLASLYNIDFDKMYTKLQSGMVGQTKPLREVGIDVTQQTLQGYLDNMGYDIAIQKLSQAEKVMLRYIAILDQSGIAHGDFAKTVESPANQIRVFTDQVKELYVWIGNTFIGLFGRIMPFINGFIMALKEVFKTIAFLFGFSLSDYEYEGFSGGLSNIEDNMDGIGTSADKTGKKIKKMLGLLGFNEINNVKTPEEPSGSSGSGGGIAGTGIYDDLALKLGEYDNLMSKVSMKATDIRNKILDWLGFQYKINEATGELTHLNWGGFSEMHWSAKLLFGSLVAMGGLKIWKLLQKIPGASLLGKKLVEVLPILGTTTGKISALGGVSMSLFGAFESFNKGKEAETFGEGLMSSSTGMASLIAGGAMLGSIFPVVGTGIGAIAGALVSLGATSVGYALSPSIEAIDLLGETSDETKLLMKPFVSTMQDTDRKLKSLSWSKSIVNSKDVAEIGNNLDSIVKMVNEELLSDMADIKKKMEEEKYFSHLNPLEQQDLLTKIQKSNDTIQRETQNNANAIKAILEKASIENRQLTESEKIEIEKLQSEMWESGVKALSKSEKEQDTILRNLKDNTVKLNSQQASEIVKQSIVMKDETIKQAQERYAGEMREAERLRDVGIITDEEYNNMIESSKKSYDEMVDNAGIYHDNILTEAKKHSGDMAKNVDWETGEIKGKFKSWFDETVNNFGNFFKEVGIKFSDFWENKVKPFFDVKKWGNLAKDAMDSMGDWLKRKWNGIWDWASSKFTLPEIKFPKIKLPHFNVSGGSWNPIDWVTGKAGIPKINIDWYKNGGFPDGENGLFYANNSELVGKFTNGKTAVANNEQIVGGISRGVKQAVVEAFGQIDNSSSGDIVINLDGKEISRHLRPRSLQLETVRG